MDPQEINKPKLTIPEHPHTGVEDAGPYVQHPNIKEELEKYGHAFDPDHESSEEHETHLLRIKEALDEAHGNEDLTGEPSQESIHQIENPQAAVSDTAGIQHSHATQNEQIKAPHLPSIIKTAFIDGIKNLLNPEKIGKSSMDPAHHGHTTVSELPRSLTQTNSRLEISSTENTPQNVTPLPVQEKEEVPHAA